MAHQSTQTLSSKSWQEITYLYAQYGLQLMEIARVKKVFGFQLEKRGIPQMHYFEAAENSFRQWHDEVDGMLVIIEAEIARRNKLIGVMG